MTANAASWADEAGTILRVHEQVDQQVRIRPLKFRKKGEYRRTVNGQRPCQQRQPCPVRPRRTGPQGLYFVEAHAARWGLSRRAATPRPGSSFRAGDFDADGSTRPASN